MGLQRDDDPVLYEITDRLGFRIDTFPPNCGQVIWGLDARATRPATGVEIELWKVYLAAVRELAVRNG